VRTLTLVLLASAALSGCGSPGCLSGDDDACIVPPPCHQVVFQCTDQSEGSAEVFVHRDGGPPVGGPDALAAPGDLVLRNSHVVAVLDGLDHPHFVAPSGGALLDLAPRGGQDGLRNLFQAAGLLPGEAVHYTEVRMLADGSSRAVQYRGTLDGHPDIHVATRYELRPCDRGVRVRTEIVNREPDPYPLFLVDAFYWGDREHLPFTPFAGFEHPSFGLTDIPDALREIPWMAGVAHGGGAASYGLTGCDRDTISGFQSREISAVGPPKRILAPRDYEVFERFVAVDAAPDVAGVAAILQDVRRQLFNEQTVTVRGRVVPEDGGPLGDTVRASVLAVGPDGPLNQAVPRADGIWDMRVPPGSLTLEVEAYGRRVATGQVEATSEVNEAPDLAIPGVGELTLEVTVDGAPDHAQVLVYPAEDVDPDAVTGQLFGVGQACAPLLGDPYGGTPACNRVLVDGSGTVRVPAGTYDVYATVGPFATVARAAGVRVEGGTAQSLPLDLVTLPVQPAGSLSADFHVHGRASFDSALPDLDRVRALLAARVEVVASTDHDVVNDYAEAMAELGACDRLRLLVGLETTGHVLFPLVEGSLFPKVIGHFNFWPVPYDPAGPWRGAPWDELAEPGELFTRVRDAGWPEQTGVIQLNHPWGGLQFGRDFAWPTAIGLDLTAPLPRSYDGTGPGLFLRTPPGAAFSNADYHAQEVMNGTSNAAFQQYRAVWHYLLSEGVVRAGTANSDSHSLTDNVLGTPRNVVFTDVTLADWDEPAFDRAVREGRMLGTNGPVILVSTVDAGGATRAPSLEAFAPDEGGALAVVVSAAPWVPVDEVRIVVNGEVARTLSPAAGPADPFGVDGIARLDVEVPLAEILGGVTGDAWIVVEAGAPLVDNADLDCDGVPDTGDANGDGRIDWRDVEGLDAPWDGPCADAVGPLAEPPLPAPGDAGYVFERVTPGGAPAAFTNPLLLDRDGGGFDGVGR
jgi:hypothetical protein